MKIYAIKGIEGTPGYVKQSMKLPKSWDTKTLADVLTLFAETYNKKAAEKVDAAGYHLERPLGSTLFPDDQVGAALSDYCDVYVVEGAVKYKGPPPGTAALLEIKEQEERKEADRIAAELELADAEESAANDAADAELAQWNVKVRCVAMDRGGMDVKSQFKVGDVVKVKIEPYATVGMLQNRLGLMVGAHPKHQKLIHPKDEDRKTLSVLEKLKDVMNQRIVLELEIAVPSVLKVVEDVSDDEGCTGPEAEEALPVASGESSDFEAQSTLKVQGDESAAAGDNAAAVESFSQAIALGGATAMLLSKRSQALLKMKRPTAAAADATAALALNPDSAKAYKLRAKARRMLGDYDAALADFGQAQRIDFDDSIAEEQSYVGSRVKKIRANVNAVAENEAAAERAAAKAAAASV